MALGLMPGRIGSGDAEDRICMRASIASICADCGQDTTPCTGKRGCRHAGRWEYYMVRNNLWALKGVGDGYLCIGCLERRIGRKLRPRDFTTAPINEPDPWDTPRLLARKLGIKD